MKSPVDRERSMRGARDRTAPLGAADMFAMPRGVDHLTRAALECHVLLVEPRVAVNPGDAGGALIAENDVWI